MMLRSTHVTVADTELRIVPPLRSALACLLTAGFSGSVTHHSVNAALADIGRVRGRMPFPFIASTPGVAALVWTIGAIGWLVVIAAIIGYSYLFSIDEAELTTDLVSGAAGAGMLLAPLWMTALHTGRRLRTAQHLVGVDRRWIEPMRAAIVAVVFPPAFTWMERRAANLAWSTWRSTAVTQLSTPNEVAIGVPR